MTTPSSQLTAFHTNPHFIPRWTRQVQINKKVENCFLSRGTHCGFLLFHQMIQFTEITKVVILHTQNYTKNSDVPNLRASQMKVSTYTAIWVYMLQKHVHSVPLQKWYIAKVWQCLLLNCYKHVTLTNITSTAKITSKCVDIYLTFKDQPENIIIQYISKYRYRKACIIICIILHNTYHLNQEFQ